MTVTVYTTGPGCVSCKSTKRHLDKRGITYTELPIDSDERIRDAIEFLEFKTAPVVCVATNDGQPEQLWDGYRPDRIDALARHINASTN